MDNHGWTFLTNHAHVLICLHRDPNLTLREVAQRVGITERAVQKIVADMEQTGILSRVREGRRNHYDIHLNSHLRHPIEEKCTIRELLDMAG
ncbi:MAG: helix-turn-helix transcriptional regulator [Opitutales bacterium]